MADMLGSVQPGHLVSEVGMTVQAGVRQWCRVPATPLTKAAARVICSCCVALECIQNSDCQGFAEGLTEVKLDVRLSAA